MLVKFKKYLIIKKETIGKTTKTRLSKLQRKLIKNEKSISWNTVFD